MATIREGNKGVFIVVDVQVGVMENAWEASRIITNIQTAVSKARQQGVPVIWVQHEDESGLAHGSPVWQIVPELVPLEGETRIYKKFNSSFEETTLEETLAEMGVTHIILAGAATNWCIRATAYAALERGYDLTLLKNAHTTETMDLGNDHKVEAADIIWDLNLTMTWLEYSGRKNGTATAENIDFNTPGGSR